MGAEGFLFPESLPPAGVRGLDVEGGWDAPVLVELAALLLRPGGVWSVRDKDLVKVAPRVKPPTVVDARRPLDWVLSSSVEVSVPGCLSLLGLSATVLAD